MDGWSEADTFAGGKTEAREDKTEADDAIRKTIETTIIETFDAMMSMALEAIADTEVAHLEEGNAMVGAIHFGGEVVGVMSFRLTESMARKVTAAMLGIELAEIKSIDKIAIPTTLNTHPKTSTPKTRPSRISSRGVPR